MKKLSILILVVLCLLAADVFGKSDTAHLQQSVITDSAVPKVDEISLWPHPHEFHVYYDN
jgi:hypothetical protein